MTVPCQNQDRTARPACEMQSSEREFFRCVFQRVAGVFAGVLLCCFLPAASSGQISHAPIILANPSFEEPPRAGHTPKDWYNCGDPGETPPDIQPGAFSVVQPASHGATCLGLVVRDNNTSEGVAQRLSHPLEQDQCYSLTMEVCRSKQYLSLSKKTNQEANYTQPAKVRIWGGNGFCDHGELLFETPLIEHHNWKKYTARLKPKKGTYSHLVIEIDFDDAAPVPYNGNVLIDNLSAVQPIPCETHTASVDSAKQRESVRSKKTSKMRTRFEMVLFNTDSDQVSDAYQDMLGDIAAFAQRSPEALIALAGHTSNNADAVFAQKLSLQRAQAVANILTELGVSSDRIVVQGFGKTQPLLPNYIPESRVKNQRVEITIWQ